MNKTLKEDYKEIAEECVERGKENAKKFDKFCEEHPWALPSIRVGLIAVTGLIVGSYTIGKRKGMKIGRIEYVCDPDIEVIAEHGFDSAAHLLDVFDEIKNLSKNKVTKF